MITEKVDRRWEVTVASDEHGSDSKLTVNSIDRDLKNVKVTLGNGSRTFSVVDIIDLLKRVAAHTNGIPDLGEKT